MRWPVNPMETTPPAAVRTVVILKPDRVYAECVRQMALRVFPAARIETTTTVEAASALLPARAVDLFITGIGIAMEGDVLELLSRYLQRPYSGRRVLVVSAQRDYRELAALRLLDVEGVFDSSSEPAEQLSLAMQAVGTGARYWSATIVEYLHRTSSNVKPVARILSVFEQLALSIIGDGSDDITAALQLGVSPATVSTVRRDIHRKLGVQHRGELVRVAAQQGFVRFTPNGVVRPGFSLLSAAYYAKKTGRHEGARACA